MHREPLLHNIFSSIDRHIECMASGGSMEKLRLYDDGYPRHPDRYLWYAC